MSDSQFPGAAPDAFPGSAGGSASIGDTTPPTAPGISGAAIVVATVTITLTLTPGTDPDDDTSTLTYNIYRDSEKIATGISETDTTWSETQPADNTTHTYGASMSDPAGNEGPITTLGSSVAWTAPSSGGSSGGSYPVYISVPAPSVNTPLTFKQGMVGQAFIVMLQQLNGEPVDLTGKSVTLRMKATGGGDPKIDAPATILLASLGIVSYTFHGTDTDTIGLFNVDFQVTNSDASPGVQIYPSDTSLRLKIVGGES